jgi:D-alanyl-D-alanine dipeptidase
MTEPNGMAEYAESHIIRAARNDAAYALTMTQRPEVSRDDLCLLVRKLANAVQDVVSVAELRGERLNEPAYGPAARALELALREALRQR